MRVFKKLITFYFLNVIIFLLIKVLFGANILGLFKSLGFWLLPLLVLLIGQAIGLLTVVVQHPLQKPKTYSLSLLFVTISFALIIFFMQFSDWKHQQKFGNIESNEDYFKYFTGESAHQQKIAFDSLSKKFTDPNDIKILGSFIDKRDTILDGNLVTNYFLTLLYQKRNYKEEYYKASFEVLNNTATMKYYDQLLSKKDYSEINSFNLKVKTTFRDAVKQVPDSLRQELNKEFPDLK